ncbi:MAG: hypothetical protein LBU62_03270 [Bacteroidales bacterium]|jgi:hypothetical protein|nr:hypothetical protein [Bacteroidales bacterium]
MEVKAKNVFNEWQQYRESLKKSTIVDRSESFSDKQKRIASLESNPEMWFAYYFPAYCTAPPADFHRKATKRVLANSEWFEVRAWSRELAKSTRTMMEVLYMSLVGIKKNWLLISNSEDNAKRLLEPYRANLDSNLRIINDYGDQRGFKKWTAAEFKTKKGVSFRAVGADQSPRGTRNDAARPDGIIFDDIDTDADTRNPEIIDKRVAWIFGAVIPTRSVNVPLTIIVCGNIIAEYCCVTEMAKKADKVDIVNIRTNGVSSWAEKNSEEHINRVLNTISYAAAQTEYFNNPQTEGRVFKKLTFGKVPPLSSMEQLLVYADPSTSNMDVKKNSFKVVVLMGRKGMETYIIKAFCEQTTNAKFVQWFCDISDLVRGLPVQYWIENNTLQDPFYQQVFVPLFREAGRAKGYMIPIRPDARKKPDKFTRIEGTLEPPVRMGTLIFSDRERQNPHMQTVCGQFTSVSPTYKGAMDAPDAVEGGYHILDMNMMARAGTYRFGKKTNRQY